MKITMADAHAAIQIPSDLVNVNTVQDGVSRLREALRLADRDTSMTDPAPTYVLKTMEGLQSWIDHARSRQQPFPNHAEQTAAINKSFAAADQVYIDAFATRFASATVVVDGEWYDVDIYRDKNGEARTGDTFNRRFDTGE